ncbi:hypothetical protein ASE17_16150 [Phenylobacterium sp. Root77]|uniref:DUF1254 domain-containing protein n=1 Tax=unclassified Phenylobacterium TaxID=2640670 RepID=UPI0006F3E03C|nr:MULTISPECIES: DUF1254 domain-containing protein [unclassified Phenylobacterium]KQW70425.1 hypothetical protein ASC73_10030 [Phenylobacterium sp. Root1277]KQW91154.1 hypothetical protein ASC79_17560 [Phenylobacterium sp. Root1290]KRC39210.1 hypothetical protein ASE17_16150 [Phenylobacterium sp. Root77]
MALHDAGGLKAATLHRRAVEAVIWGIPLVNYDLMYQAFRRLGGAANQIVYWSQLLDWKNQTTTPNPNSIYFMPFYDTADAGPILVEIPPAEGGSITGTLMDCWQTAFEDVGPAGVDKGKGGKYLILPPGYDGDVPDGYAVFRSDVHQGYGLLRSILKSGAEADLKAAVEYGKRIKLYPLSLAGAPPDTVLIDSDGKLFDATIPYDVRFFETLARMVESQPWIERDRMAINMLRSIGIEKGKPFAPDAATREILIAAAQEAKLFFDQGYEAFAPYYDGRRWFLPSDAELHEVLTENYARREIYPIDARGFLYYAAFTSVKHLGAGQFYLFGTRDAAGDPLDGGASYRLTVPPNAPVHQYWSVTLYDFNTHALIRDVSRASRASDSPGLQTNADGSADVFFGPEPPSGMDANWVPTKPGGRFEMLFRFYGPDKPLFDKTWVLPDVERMS